MWYAATLPTMACDDHGNPWLRGDGPRGDEYDRRFDRLAATGHNVHGEADLVESLGMRCVLDAGCGTGRVAIELARRGLDVVGVDVDDSMLVAARAKAPSIPWISGDLIDVDVGRRFDGVVLAGNVMIFLTPGTEGAVLANLARHLSDAGRLVAGFSLVSGGLDERTYDHLAAAADLELDERWATWDRRGFVAGSDYAVSVHRKVRS